MFVCSGKDSFVLVLVLVLVLEWLVWSEFDFVDRLMDLVPKGLKPP
jgi:hypothetical protein